MKGADLWPCCGSAWGEGLAQLPDSDFPLTQTLEETLGPRHPCGRPTHIRFLAPNFIPAQPRLLGQWMRCLSDSPSLVQINE